MPRHVGARDALKDYHAKRSAGATPEPAGAVAAEAAAARAQIFVVQKHAARQLHYDLRLELDGVLKSWAVPKGPSRNPADKRAAILVEDHPVEYADFEGVIPEGNYGAGAMIVWDRGVWVPLEDPVEGLEKGKLLFELRGYKLRGVWTLVKMKKTERDWLLIKERDALASDPGDDWAQDSVLSGLTVEQLGSGGGPGAEIGGEAKRLGAVRRALRVADLEPMLAETADDAFTAADWVFELKYDGYRFLAGRDGDEVRLQTRNGRDATATFPEVARALAALPHERFVADGEIVVHDEAGLPSFQRLQRRAGLSRAIDVRNAAIALPATLYLFDLLGFGEHDLRGLPLLERKRLLRMMLPSAGPLRYSDHIAEQGVAFHEQVARLGLEGIVAKKAQSRYRSGRSGDWLKIHAHREADFVVVGFTEPKGARGGFGALQLAAYDGDRLVYCGTVGSGFTQKQLDETHARLLRSVRPTPPCEHAPSRAAHTWVEPALVVVVRYREVTDERLLRHPVFLRFRDDKAPRDCPLPDAARTPAHVDADEEPPLPAPADAQTEERRVRFTNLKKVFWPEDGYTKGDLVDYYRAVAPWLLPYLRDRPVVLTRYPDGIHGKSFFQKDAPGFTPGWLRTERVWSAASERELSYFVCEDEAGLLYLANSATIPLHIWSSRIGSLEQPDWCILDLDPKGAPFEDVVEVGHAVRALCDDIGLPSFAKTSGSSGLHVLVPLARQFTHDQARVLGELLARVVVDQLPAIATIERAIDQRAGKVYVDFLQNGHGKLLVAPFSVRPIPAAPVSMPLPWEEVGPSLRSDAYTIADAPARLREHGDPLRAVLLEKPDLLAALQRLAGRV
jgi:bifunctional non-homologous end joining protein LigD